MNSLVEHVNQVFPLLTPIPLPLFEETENVEENKPCQPQSKLKSMKKLSKFSNKSRKMLQQNVIISIQQKLQNFAKNLRNKFRRNLSLNIKNNKKLQLKQQPTPQPSRQQIKKSKNNLLAQRKNVKRVELSNSLITTITKFQPLKQKNCLSKRNFKRTELRGTGYNKKLIVSTQLQSQKSWPNKKDARRAKLRQKTSLQLLSSSKKISIKK